MSSVFNAKSPYRQLLLQALPVIVAICFWELFVRFTDNQLIPTPSQTLKAVIELTASHVLFEDCLFSLKRVVLGFVVASFAGVILGFGLGLSPLFKSAFSSLIELLRPIPPIAWIPIAITLFGIGDASACFVIFVGAFYPIVTNTYLGVSEVPATYLEAARLLGASSWRIYKEVVFPAALPSIFAGLRVGLGIAWMCVVAAEMIAARSGLGYEIQLNRQLLQLDRVVAGMAVIGIIGVCMNKFMQALEARVIVWRNQKQDSIQSAAPDCDLVPDLSKETKTLSELAAIAKPRPGASVEVKQVSFAYAAGSSVIERLNLSIKAGEAFSILGGSGCGKTTILRLMAGLLEPHSGQMVIDGGPLAAHRRETTMVFQGASLFPWLTAIDNVAFALISRGMSRQTAQSLGQKYLHLVGVDRHASHYPHQFSGGQQQRVALARALAFQPRLILMDEPFSQLDSQTRESLQEDVSRLLRAMGITLVLVTHDIREAMFMSDRIAVLSASAKTVVREFIVAEPRPRGDEFRYRPEFGRLRAEIWNCLEGKDENHGERLDATQHASV